MKAIVVDDESLILVVTKKMLSSIGHTVIGEALSGEEALNLVKETKPDIAFLDISMPGSIDGIETAKILLNQYNIPVIFITAYSEKVMRDRLENIKDNYGYLVKPFNIEELEKEINKIITKKSKNN